MTSDMEKNNLSVGTNQMEVERCISLLCVCGGVCLILRRIRNLEKRILMSTPQPYSFATQTDTHTKHESDSVQPSDFVCIRRDETRFCTFGNHVLASDWVYDRPIVSIDENVTAIEALSAMHASRSSCAIVKGNKDEFLGMVDLLDAVRYMLRGSNFESPTARRLLRLCVVASDHATLGDICEYLRAGNRHIAIAHADGNHQIISQRSVALAIQKLNPTLSTSLSSANLPSWGRVICAQDDWTARKAFESMVAYDITSVPICNREGKAISVISASDALHAWSDTALLDDNIVTFIERGRALGNTCIPPNVVISCHSDDTMTDALEKMLSNKVHHVYVLSSSDAPLGVVSFVDVLRRL